MKAALSPPAMTPYLVAVVAFAMAFMATCTFEAQHQVIRVAAHWQTDLAGVATVRLPHDADASATLRALRQVDGVVQAEALPRERVAALVVPWLGTAPDASLLPLPQIIDVRFADVVPDVGAVQAILPIEAVYDDHRLWTVPLLETARRVEQLIAVAVGMTAFSLVAMVVVAARAALAGAAGTVRTLQLLGAQQGFIAARFDRGIGIRALLGAATGTAVGVAALPVVPGISGLASPAPLLVALPLAAGALAWLTARMAILLMLRVER